MKTKTDAQRSSNDPSRLSLRRETLKLLGVRTGVKTGMKAGDSCTNNSEEHSCNSAITRVSWPS
jgi:hypothetical protein